MGVKLSCVLRETVSPTDTKKCGAARPRTDSRGDAGQAILPPPCLVTTTTAGRTGSFSSKSGQRVAGVS